MGKYSAVYITYHSPAHYRGRYTGPLMGVLIILIQLKEDTINRMHGLVFSLVNNFNSARDENLKWGLLIDLHERVSVKQKTTAVAINIASPVTNHPGQ